MISQKNQKKSSLQQRIKELLDNKCLRMKLSKCHNPSFQFSEISSFEDNNLRKMLEAGQQCCGIVIQKDQIKKQLLIHLTKLLIPLQEKPNKYIPSSHSHQTILSSHKQVFISHLKQYGFIKDYDLKESFSIFTYINAYKDVKVGTEVIGMIKRKEKREIHEPQHNAQITIKQNAQTLMFQISIKNELIHLRQRHTGIRYGLNYHQRFEQTVDDSYRESGDFSIAKLALYNQNFQNDQILASLSSKLDIKLCQSINPISNIKALKQMGINFQRIRQNQQKKWSNQHFTQGMQFLKKGSNQSAIDCFDVAKKFDKHNEKILIGKGCALANMNNYSQGLKEIKQALKINPNNQQANQYYKVIREKLRDKEKDPVPELRKKFSNS